MTEVLFVRLDEYQTAIGSIDASQIVSGVLAAARMPAYSGDATSIAGATALTLATVNLNVGTFGSATKVAQATVNAKGLVTAVSELTVTPAVGSITGLGTGIAAALAINTGSAGAPVLFNGALGSPSTAGTLPAHTLGGTISGGGNQINNVIIGTVTPLAGLFTTLSASTSITSPLHVGGAAAGSVHEVRSTTGTGSGDAVTITGGTNGATRLATFLGAGRVGFGSTAGAVAPTGTQVLISNSNTIVSGVQSGLAPALQIVGADTQIPVVLIDAFGTVGGLGFRAANGTAALPTAVTAGFPLGAFFGYGNDGTAAYGFGAQIDFTATQTWTSIAHGAAVRFLTAPNGSVTVAEVGRIQQGLSLGTTTDPGIGAMLANVSVSAPLFKSVTAPTAVSGAGPVAIGSASTINARMKVNLNGTDYWIPLSTTAF